MQWRAGWTGQASLSLRPSPSMGQEAAGKAARGRPRQDGGFSPSPLGCNRIGVAQAGRSGAAAGLSLGPAERRLATQVGHPRGATAICPTSWDAGQDRGRVGRPQGQPGSLAREQRCYLFRRSFYLRHLWPWSHSLPCRWTRCWYPTSPHRCAPTPCRTRWSSLCSG